MPNPKPNPKPKPSPEPSPSQVVVKAQHRGVASLMKQDMANLRSILSIVARFDKDADFGPVVREWTSEVLKELDFRTEAANMAEVRAL